MPHITLQFTSNIKSLPNFNKLFSEVHRVLNDNAGIKIENCKSKAIQLENFYVGDGTKNKGFLHLEVKILEGRTIEAKSEIGKSLLQILKTQFKKNINLIDLQITVEIIDIKKNCYYKYPKGTLKY